jgi:hypothetical protein
MIPKLRIVEVLLDTRHVTILIECRELAPAAFVVILGADAAVVFPDTSITI